MSTSRRRRTVASLLPHIFPLDLISGKIQDSQKKWESVWYGTLVYRSENVPVVVGPDPVTVVVWLVPAPTGRVAWYVMLEVNEYDTLAVGVKNRSNLVWAPGASVMVCVCDETMIPFPSTMLRVTVMSTAMRLRLLTWYLTSSCEGTNGCGLKVIASTVGATCTVMT